MAHDRNEFLRCGAQRLEHRLRRLLRSKRRAIERRGPAGEPRENLGSLPRSRERTRQQTLGTIEESLEPFGRLPCTRLSLGRQRTRAIVRPSTRISLECDRVPYDQEIHLRAGVTARRSIAK